MTAFLNIALLVIGTMATLAAFGGQTCRDGAEPILERVTARGWISLMCLVMALAIGTIKELVTQREDAKQAVSAAREKADADRKQAEQSARLAESNSRLALASKSLEDLRKIDQITQDRLSDTTTTLDEVRKNLSSTRDDLTQQSAANQVTSLVNAGQNVRMMLLLLPLTAKARPSAKFGEAFLPSFDLSACRELTGTELRVSMNERDSERIVHDAGDVADEQDDFKQPMQKAEFLVGPSNHEKGVTEALKNISRLAGQKSSNGYVYFAAINTLHHSVSAGRLYATFTRRSAQPFAILMSWPTIFKTRQAYEIALKKYPDMLNRNSDQPLPNENIELDSTRQHPYPAACSSQVQQYFASAFDKAVLELILDQGQSESEVIMFKLKALPPKQMNGKWYVSFQVASSPELGAADDAFLKNLLDIWPAEPKPDTATK